MSETRTILEPALDPVPPKRVLILGGSGMLGQDVVREFAHRNWQVFAPTLEELDVTWPQHLEKLRVRDFGDFDWVVNCAAYTNVDEAESNMMQAMKLNGVAPGMIGVVCAQNGWRLLHVSTDFVFDGESAVPYTEDRVPNPIGVYGKSKLLGEQNVKKEAPESLIVRTAWLFGPSGKCFPRLIIGAWLAGKELKVVADQTGSPTYTADLARVLGDLVAISPAPGIYNAVGPEVMNWHNLAIATLEAYRSCKRLDKPIKVSAISSSDWPTAAKRPSYSVLSQEKLAGTGTKPMRSMKEALAEFSQRLVIP